MRLWSDTFRDGGVLPAKYAFAEIDPASRNLHLARDEVPNGDPALAITLKK